MRLSRKLRWRLVRLVSCREAVSKEERYLMILVRKLLSDKSSELLMNPSLTKVYMKSDVACLFVCIDCSAGRASVINHKFGYDLVLSHRVLDAVTDWFAVETEGRRDAMETEYRRNVQFSLVAMVHSFTGGVSGEARS